jgi:rieske iron-sulfur protein
MRPENREAGWYVRRICRRTAIELGVCLVLAPRVVCAQTDAKRERPREGDLLVAIGGTTPEPLKPDDVPPSGKLTMAWPLDPTDNTVRDGSRLNKVLLLRLDPESLDTVTRDRAAEGVVAYSAICTHAGCDVIDWHPEAQRLECPCHNSQFDPAAAAKVVGGPAPRSLPALPLKITAGRLVVAKPFTGRAGFQQM